MTSQSSGKITRRHLERKAYVYVRQSTMHQVLHHTESQQRQYELVQRAKSLGWPSHQITVIDQDLGQSGADRARQGFQRLVAEVGLGHVGIIFGLEVSRLARNNADWYQLLDLCAICSTLIADSDGLYDPAHYNDRLLLGLKGTMSEAELHLIRNRMQGGLIHKAQKGQLRTWLPAGYEYDDDGNVIKNSNEAIVTAIDMVFHQFRTLGSARMVMTWLHAEDIALPVAYPGKGIVWQKPSYRTVHRLLTNPIYAGAYVYGRVKYEKVIGQDGKVQVKGKKLAREQWPILIQDHHGGYITWEEYLENQERLKNNFKGPNSQGAPQNGAALLQGLLICGKCGRRMQVSYSGTKGNVLRYSCHQAQRMQSAEQICQSLGGKKLDQAVVDLFLQTITPARVQAIITALEQAEEYVQAEKLHWQKQLEKARYEAERAKRQYDRVEPENRLVAKAIEKAWEERLREVERLEQILREKESQAYHPLTAAEKKRMESLGSDLRNIWTAETTTSKDRKELLRTLISEIIVLVNRDDHAAQCTILWEGGAHNTFTHRLNRTGRHNRCTDEEIVELVRKLANHYPDEMIARILNRQHLKTGQGNSFTAGRICSLRHHHGISKYMGSSSDTEGRLYNVEEAAEELKVSKATLLRWLREGFIRGVQLTPGAPWQIDITEELRTKIVPTVPDGWVPLNEAAFALGCTKQTVLNRMRSGKLKAIYVCQGKRQGYRFFVGHDKTQPDLFDLLEHGE